MKLSAHCTWNPALWLWAIIIEHFNMERVRPPGTDLGFSPVSYEWMFWSSSDVIFRIYCTSTIFAFSRWPGVLFYFVRPLYMSACMYSHGSGPGWRAHRLWWAERQSGCPAADSETRSSKHAEKHSYRHLNPGFYFKYYYSIIVIISILLKTSDSSSVRLPTTSLQADTRSSKWSCRHSSSWTHRWCDKQSLK